MNWKISPRPVVGGARAGSPASGGMSARAASTRSFTIWRASHGSTPSSNTTVTDDTPGREMLRRFDVWAMPVSERSRGIVMKRSTSTAPSPGLDVSTWTWTFVRSGNASNVVVRTHHAAAAAASSVSATTHRRCCTDSAMSAPAGPGASFWG